jgi:tetratricopeptide (TPR) repeat protein
MEMTIAEAMQLAVAHHQAGRVSEAEKIYHQVLECKRDHPDALHLLGVLACQAGDLAVAIDLIRQAISIEPRVAQNHGNLGEAYRRAARWNEATDSLRRAIALKPDLAEAHHNLGIALQGKGRLDEAIAAYQRAVQLAPHCGDAYHRLGTALETAGRLDEAIRTLDQAVSLLSGNAEAHNSRGLVLQKQGRLNDAIAAFERALQLMPDHWDDLRRHRAHRGRLIRDGLVQRVGKRDDRGAPTSEWRAPGHHPDS